jgi:hypothetical protein
VQKIQTETIWIAGYYDPKLALTRSVLPFIHRGVAEAHRDHLQFLADHRPESAHLRVFCGPVEIEKR